MTSGVNWMSHKKVVELDMCYDVEERKLIVTEITDLEPYFSATNVIYCASKILQGFIKFYLHYQLHSLPPNPYFISITLSHM